MQMSEEERIEYNGDGIFQEPPPVAVVIQFRSTGSASNTLLRIKQVMLLIALMRKSGWPIDSWWKEHLPKWFLPFFEGKTLDEIIQNPLLWDFGSWLDAMKAPGWEWWSSVATEKSGTIGVRAHDDPYSIEPLKHLIRCAGGDRIEVVEK